mgnify:FL=1
MAHNDDIPVIHRPDTAMRLRLLPAAPLAAVLLAALPAIAAEPTAHAAHATAAQALTDGVVKKIDKAAGRVTLTHGPLNGMPGMTMAFAVKDPAWLDTLKPGERIRFAADTVNGALTVVKIERP